MTTLSDWDTPMTTLSDWGTPEERRCLLEAGPMTCRHNPQQRSAEHRHAPEGALDDHHCPPDADPTACRHAPRRPPR
ncbi:hypothetical protein ACIHIX_31870 [Streptomyces sp. NPDC051913]|uniref:hypothetical protein n=1 Tax=Streptomyces sp. NPDC051913 TaxID=3365676 RepID=UPI0037D069C1